MKQLFFSIFLIVSCLMFTSSYADCPNGRICCYKAGKLIDHKVEGEHAHGLTCQPMSTSDALTVCNTRQKCQAASGCDKAESLQGGSGGIFGGTPNCASHP